jgi:pleiotropic regulator 1
MIRFWDIRMGRTTEVLTQHKKGVRAMAMHAENYTFASVDSDKIRIWKCPEGDELNNVAHPDNIVNTLAANADNVLVSGSNEGVLRFYDWESGHNF